MSKLQIYIAVIVTVIWATGYTISFVDRSFSPSPTVSGIMLAIVTAIFGTEIKKRIQGDKEE